MDKTKLRSLVRAALRVHQVKDGDVILLKAHTAAMTDKQAVHDFANAIRRGGRPNCVLIALDDFDDLAVLNDEDMAKHGWVRLNHKAGQEEAKDDHQ